ncbi:MAG TPA: ATP-binding protein [Opitutaceae bacterium]|nr:ATP-binding protein [Opitutaceae bacterium]
MPDLPPGDRPTEERVLLFVATARDAKVSTRLLAGAGLEAVTCTSLRQLTREIEAGAAAVVATDQILSEEDTPGLLRLLARQPEWSDLPFILMLRGGTQSARATEILDRLTNATILDRPAGMRSVLSAVRAAVRARRRQYRTRGLIDALREAETRTRDAHRAKDDFLAALSHELRTPLTPVLLTASEAAGDPSLPAPTRELFETIAQNVALEARLIDDLLDLTQITRGKLILREGRIDGLRVLRDAIRNVRPDYDQKRIEIVTDIAPASVPMIGDATRLQQVFWNVLRNAAKFTPPAGRVTVRARELDGDLEVVIEDSGIGMEPDEISRAFDAFAQGDHAGRNSAHRFGGLGLGLAISRSLVELHGGRIVASSAGRGRGSSFRITIPRRSSASVPPSGPATPAAASPVHGPLRILLVEDEPSSRTALERLLGFRGHTVTGTDSVAGAVAAAAKERFDVLLSDIGLPDGSGYGLLARLGPNAPPITVALTGYGMEEDVHEARRAGYLIHVIKPLRADDLDRVLDQAAAMLARGEAAVTPRPSPGARPEPHPASPPQSKKELQHGV